MRGRAAVKAYVESLGHEAHEWLLALYVDEHLQLLAVDTLAKGDISSCEVPYWTLLTRAKGLNAAGFLLVHNHPSGDPRASEADIQATRRLAQVSKTLGIPLLDHFIVAGEMMEGVGGW